MAKDSSFDIVSDYDLAKLTNAVEQTQRDIASRYDFKHTSADLSFIEAKSAVQLTGDNQFQLDSIIELLRKRLAGCQLSQKLLDTSRQPVTNNFKINWRLDFKKGLDKDKVKQLSKLIRDTYPKLKLQPQGEEIRVSSPKRDELQAVIQLLKQADIDYPLHFTNFK